MIQKSVSLKYEKLCAGGSCDGEEEGDGGQPFQRLGNAEMYKTGV